MTYDLDQAPSTPRLRTVFGAFLSIFALSLANEAFDWRFVGDYDWEAVLVVTLLGLVGMAAFLPSALRR